MTQVVRLKMTAPGALDVLITNECNVRLAAGFKLAAAFPMGDDLVLIFQN
jgi:hypothetical protein